MMHIEATVQYAGYDPRDLSKWSKKRVCCVCDVCGRVRWARFDSHTDICGTCSRNTDAHRRKQSEAMKRSWAENRESHMRGAEKTGNKLRGRRPAVYSCRKCNKELVIGDDVTQLQIDNFQYICRECLRKYQRDHPHNAMQRMLWRKANPDKIKFQSERSRLKRGCLSMSENRECSSFLGVHVAERVLEHVFKDVEKMPYGNSGYDFICRHDKMIDVKSSCLHKSMRWMFHIRHNTTADFFLCLAFDNRKDLNPVGAWLIPGSILNNLVSATICPSTFHKWDEYLIDITKISTCCDILKGGDVV